MEDKRKKKKINIQSQNVMVDSLFAVQELESGPTDTQDNKRLKELVDLSLKNKVVVQWIPAHTGLLGNDKAK